MPAAPIELRNVARRTFGWRAHVLADERHECDGRDHRLDAQVARLDLGASASAMLDLARASSTRDMTEKDWPSVDSVVIQHAHAGLAERGENAAAERLGQPGAARLHADEREALEAGDAGRAVRVGVALGVDRACRGRRAGVVLRMTRAAAALAERDARARMEHPCAEIGQLQRLVVGQPVDRRRLAHERRVGGHHAEQRQSQTGDGAGLEQAGDEGGGVVGAVAAERGGVAVLGAGR